MNIINDEQCIGTFLLETKLKGYNKEIFIEGTRYRATYIKNKLNCSGGIIF